MRTMQHPMTRKPGPRRALRCVRCSTRELTRTLPVEQPSNSVTGGRSCARPVETEVSDGLYLVVTGVVLHRVLHRDADHRTDVHVRFPVRTVGANSATHASRFVGRVLTRRDRRADTRRPLFASSETLQRTNASAAKEVVSTPSRREMRGLVERSPVETGLFFFGLWCNTLSTTTPIQRQHRMARIAPPGRDCLPGACETDVPKDWR